MDDREIDQLIQDLQTDYQKASITASEKAVLAYASKLTMTPWKIKEKDITNLRNHGFNDRAIHDICTVTAYFAFVNRIADGLGVELEK